MSFRSDPPRRIFHLINLKSTALGPSLPCRVPGVGSQPIHTQGRGQYEFKNAPFCL